MGKKRKFSRIEIVDIAHKGKTIGKTPEGEVVMVNGAIPGEIISGLGIRKRKGMWNVIPQEILEVSPWQADPVCKHFDTCGGCKWQNLVVERQLELKENQVHQTIHRLTKAENPEYLPIVPSPKTYSFRNKLEFSFSTRRWLSRAEIESGLQLEKNGGLGFHPAGRFDKVVDIETCHLMPNEVNDIRNQIKSKAHLMGLPFYDCIKHEGNLRSLIFRMNRKGEIMLILVHKGLEKDIIDDLLHVVMDTYKQIVSIYTVENAKLNDSIYDLEPRHYHGKSFLEETIADLHFRIGPKSFFQTNIYQTEQLYAFVKEWAALRGDEVVYDLYSGIGSIALYVADQAKHVIGVESIEEATNDAIDNAEFNGIKNVSFRTGQLEKLVNDQVLNDLPRPDLIITDPPRAGMHKDVVRFILKQAPERILYVSCDVSTQARDIALMSHRYTLERVQPFDMFPHTAHVESLAMLKRI